MLYIYFGSINGLTAPMEYVAHIDAWFDGYYKKEWMDNSWAKRVVQEIDKSELVSPEAVDSPWLGIIPITSISGGAKQLIMANAASNIVFNGDNFGDNCFPLLLELSKSKDIMMNLYYHPDFVWVPGVKVKILNSGRIVDNIRDFGLYHIRDGAPGESEFASIKWPLALDEEIFRKDDWFDSFN